MFTLHAICDNVFKIQMYSNQLILDPLANHAAATVARPMAVSLLFLFTLPLRKPRPIPSRPS